MVEFESGGPRNGTSPAFTLGSEHVGGEEAVDGVEFVAIVGGKGGFLGYVLNSGEEVIVVAGFPKGGEVACAALGVVAE